MGVGLKYIVKPGSLRDLSAKHLIAGNDQGPSGAYLVSFKLAFQLAVLIAGLGISYICEKTLPESSQLRDLLPQCFLGCVCGG